MRSFTPKRIPVLVSFTGSSAKGETWGHLERLSATAASLSLMTPVTKKEELFLSFELHGESFSSFSARAAWSEVDADGYTLVDVRLTDKIAQRRLAKVLLELLASVA